MDTTLQLVTMLHTLYTSQARQLMPAPLREVLALCREELAILHESDKAIKEKSIANAAAKAAAAGAVSPAERALQVHIGHCQSWLQNLRDSAYSILAAATLAGPALFQSYSPQALVASVFSHLDSMDARHLRMLIERFVTPLCANCPVEDYQRLLLPVLQVIITTVFGRLSTGWLMASDEDSEVNDLSVLEEMIEDRMLRDLTRAFGFFVANMCVPHAGYGVAGMTLSTSIAAANNARKAAAGSGGASGGAASSAAAGFRSSSHQDVFCAFVLANENLYSPLFAALTGCLCWPDNLAARRAITVLTRFIPLVVDKPPFHPIFANVLTAALRRLMPMRADEAQTCHAQVVVLVREIYFNFIKFSTMPRDVFASLPNMAVSDLQVRPLRMLSDFYKSSKIHIRTH
jgi:hypothetical protein